MRDDRDGRVRIKPTLRWPSTARANLQRQAPTSGRRRADVDTAGDHADPGHPSRTAGCPTATLRDHDRVLGAAPDARVAVSAGTDQPTCPPRALWPYLGNCSASGWQHQKLTEGTPDGRAGIGSAADLRHCDDPTAAACWCSSRRAGRAERASVLGWAASAPTKGATTSPCTSTGLAGCLLPGSGSAAGKRGVVLRLMSSLPSLDEMTATRRFCDEGRCRS